MPHMPYFAKIQLSLECYQMYMEFKSNTQIPRQGGGTDLIF